MATRAPIWRRLIGLALGVGGAALAFKVAQAKMPKVTPVAGKPALILYDLPLEQLGYAESEFFLEGEAARYDGPEPPADGAWTVKPTATAPYVTRIVVLRPADATRFNGTVLVEWLNVSGGLDSPADWFMAHREIIRAGYAYVAVTAQKVGVDGGTSMGPGAPLKKTHPERYGALNHPGDAYAYDIFTQAGRVVRAARPGGVLGPLSAKQVIALGESQSAAYMATYVDAVDPLAKVYDGFLIHSRTSLARLSGASLFSEAGGHLNVRMRRDLRVPVLTLITETDLIGYRGPGFYGSRQPDTPKLRTWEVAGTAHADTYTTQVAPLDTGLAPLETLAAAYTPGGTLMGRPTAKPINSAPQHHYVLQAGLRALERWVRTGEAPPSAPMLELNDATLPSLVLDENGLAKGGVRSPWVDVPTARLSGAGNSGDVFAALFGTTEDFDAATLERLYPGGKDEYLKRFEAGLDEAIAAGFILADDRAEILGIAALRWPAGA